MCDSEGMRDSKLEEAIFNQEGGHMVEIPSNPFGSTTASLFHFYAEFQEENVCLNQVSRSKGLLAPQRNIGSARVG